MRFLTFYMLGQLAALTLACVDKPPSGRLNKPTLAKTLNYLKPALAKYLPPVNATVHPWNNGSIPFDCKSIVLKRNLSAADFETFDIHYDDCSIPWTVCKQKQGPGSLDNLVHNFGRVPVRARSWVRHVIDIHDPKSPGGWGAVGTGSTIELFNRVDKGVPIFIHETGHVLDANAYHRGIKLSNSTTWLDSYNKDSSVPDHYAGNNFLEDVAQMTVIAAYDLNVPGGFRGIEPAWRNISNQLATLESWQRFAGNLLVRGGHCVNKVAPSPAVPIAG